MDKHTKIILVIASVALLLMILSLGHDFFSGMNASRQQSYSASSVSK